MVTLEQLLNLIADKLITNLSMFSDTEDDGDENTLTPNETVYANQQFVRNNLITIGRTQISERMLVYESSTAANQKDIEASQDGGLNFHTIICDINGCSTDPNIGTCEHSGCVGIDISQVGIAIGGDSINGAVVTLTAGLFDNLDITSLLVSGTDNPLNISGFVPLSNQQDSINPQSAREYLDTVIYELLPGRGSRQQRINAFFEEYQALKGHIPNIQDYDEDGSIETEIDYTQGHDISWAQDNPSDTLIEESDAFITRLEIDANTNNKNKSLEALRNDLNKYLKDVDQDFIAEITDERPEYENKSDGFLKIRNLNQGIIIRKQEGDEVGLEKMVVKPTGTSLIDSDGNEYFHPHADDEVDGIGPSYLMDGFTISMWVKFLDKTSRGTLFNYGNPTRSYDPRGFKLETYILGKDEYMSDGNTTWGEAAGWHQFIEQSQTDLFQNNDYERFIRLVVYDHIPAADAEDPERRLYDSRLGIPGLPREYNFVPEIGYSDTVVSAMDDYQKAEEKYLLAHVRIPVDFNEWYFIVASYNPMINDEIPVDDNLNLRENPDYWRGNINPNDGSYTHYSYYGTKCKVEVISKSDLLRARGYKV